VTTPHPAESLVYYGPAVDAAIEAAKRLNLSPGSVDSPEVIGRLIAAEVLRVAIPRAAKAERERLYAELGNDHWVIFTEDGWTTEHSIDCRLSGQMSSCAWHEAVRRIAHEFDPDMAGRWLITAIDGNGEPALVRADLIEKDPADDA
jgi:hypothetical protein